VLDFIVNAPGIKQILNYMWAALNNARELRLLQSQNAPAPVSEANVTVNDAGTFQVPGTDNMAILYSMLVVATDEASGRGRYLSSGRRPTATGQGIPWPSAGASVTIRGNDQIRKFQIIAETGQVLNVWWGLFQ
jgi:hypothetical protein